MMAAVLTPPSPQQAERIVRELDYDERFGGYLYKASGMVNVTLYSLESTIGFLGKDNTADTVEEGSCFGGTNVQIAYVQPAAAAQWIEEVLGDGELADAIREAAAEVPEERGYQPAMRAMRELMSQRFVQCMEVLGIDPDAEDEQVPAEEATQ